MGIQQPTQAIDNSITFGPNDLQILNLDYELKVAPDITVNINTGLSIIGVLALSDNPVWHTYGIGVSRYFNGEAFQGGYAGLQVTHVAAKGDVGWADIFEMILGGSGDSNNARCSPFEYYTATLGYKKVTESRFTFDSAVHIIYVEDIWGISGKLALGYSW